MWMLHHSTVFGVDILVFLSQLKKLERMTYLNEFGEDFRRITVHDLYREFAEWHVAQSSEEDANKATCIYHLGGKRLPSMLKKGRAGKCWEELSRVRLDGLSGVNILPPHSNEWANVVVLRLEKCPDLTSLNIQGMECLQHLQVKFFIRLEKLEVCLPRLQYLRLTENYVLKNISGICQCGELVSVQIWGCPKLLLQSMDFEACPKLKRLFMWLSCWTWRVVLTQNLQLLRICDVKEISCKGRSEEYPRTTLEVLQHGAFLRILDLKDVSLMDSKFLDTLSGLKSLQFTDVTLMDGGILNLAGCINLRVLSIIGGNVHTITCNGISHPTLKHIWLRRMKELQSIPPFMYTRTCICNCGNFSANYRANFSCYVFYYFERLISMANYGED